MWTGWSRRLVSDAMRAGALCAFIAMAAMGSIAAAEEINLNDADRSRLEQLPGVGVAKADAILAERSRGGPFKSWSDFERRVKGFGRRSTERLQAQGAIIVVPESTGSSTP